MAYPIVGNNGDFIKRKIIFAPPPHDVVVKITSSKSDILVESVEIVEAGFALVKGYLNKSVEYNTTNRGLFYKLMGKVEGEAKEETQCNDGCNNQEQDGKKKREVSCESILPEPQAMAVDGVVRHTTVWIPFSVLVKVEGAKCGDCAVVEAEEPKVMEQSKILQDQIIEDGIIIGLCVNEVVNVTVTVTEAC